jgi:hypothetical protein
MSFTNIVRPSTLQLQHQPQMHVPSMSVPWYSNRPAINPAVLGSPFPQHNLDGGALMQQRGPDMTENPYAAHDSNGHNNHDGCGLQGQNHGTDLGNDHPNWTSFTTDRDLSFTSPLLREGPSSQFVTPVAGHTATSNSYHGVGYGADNSPGYGISERGHRTPVPSQDSWQDGAVHGGWSDAQLYHSNDGPHAFSEHQQVQARMIPDRMPPLRSASFQKSPYGLSTGWSSPYATPPSRAKSVQMLQQPKEQNRNNSVPYIGSSHLGSGGLSEPHRLSIPLVWDPASANHQPKNGQEITKPRKTKETTAPARFVHAICGKSFNSRSAVKKHHWGKQADDPSTTTGCWAKHQKPNRAWQVPTPSFTVSGSRLTHSTRNEHPSCDYNTPHSYSASKSLSSRYQVEEPQPWRAPVVPAMTSQLWNMAPGFTSLHRLPNTFAETANAMPVSDRERVPYITSRMPSGGGLDTLLTAPNAVSKVDGPVPQGRNDSVVSHLDPQATAEHNVQFPEPSQAEIRKDGQFFREKLPVIGLGITQAYGLSMLSDAVPLPPNENVSSSEPQEGSTSLELDQLGYPGQRQDKDTIKRSRRSSSRKSTVLQQEQKALEVSASPSPDRKKQKH